MQNTTSRRRIYRRKRHGVSSIIGTIFFVLIVFVVFTIFMSMFNSFVSYTNTVNQVDQQRIQNSEISLSSDFQFGSSEVPSGTSNPPSFLVNSIASPGTSPSLIQVAQATCTTTTCAASFGSSVTSGDLIVAALGTDQSGAASGETDSFTDTFNLGTSDSVTCGNYSCYSYIWYATAQNSGSDTITITLSTPPHNTHGETLNIFEIRYATTTGFQTSTGTSPGSTSTSVTSFSPASDSIIIGSASEGGGSGGVTWTAGTGYVLSGTCTTTIACSEYETGVSSSTTAPMSFSGASEPWVSTAISFAPSTTPSSMYPFQGKLFYAQGLFWAFYSTGSAIVYQTSANGIGWSTAGTLTNAAGSSESYGFAGWVSSTSTLYYVLSQYGGSNALTIADVPLNSGGTIGTITSTTFTLQTGYNTYAYDSIAGDTSGNIWVAVTVNSGTHSYVQVVRCISTLSTCSAMDGKNPPSITLATPNTHDLIPIVLSMSGGSMAVLYADSGGTNQVFAANAFSIQTCTGGTGTTQCQTTGTPTWSARATTTSTFYPEFSDAVSIGSTLYFVGPNATGVGTWSCTFSSATPPCGGAAIKAYQVDSSVEGASAMVGLQEYGTGNSLGTGNDLVLYYGSGSNLYLSTSITDTTWTTRQIVSTTETTLTGLQTISNGTESGAFWMSGSAQPYTIRFALLNTDGYNPTQISPVTVSTSTTSTATANSPENKLFYASGLWWVFYSNGSGISYATSSDGLIWSSPTSMTSVAGSGVGSDFSVIISGNTVYWVLSSGDTTNSFVYDTGTLSPTGTISFATTATVPTTYDTYGPISIGVDSAGNTWVSATTLTGTTYHLEVYEHNSGAPSGTWSSNLAPSSIPSLTATAYSIIDVPSGYAGAILTVETSGTTGTGAISLYTTSVTSGWSASTWNTAVSPPSDYALASSSEVVIGDTYCFAGLASRTPSATTGTLRFWTYTLGLSPAASATSSEQTIESSTAAWQAAIEANGNTLVLYDSSGGTLNYYYSGNLGSSWSEKSVATEYEASITGLTAAGSSTFAAIWTASNDGSNNIRFGSLSSLTVTNNGGSTVNMVSLYVYNPATNTLITYYQSNSTELFNYWIAPGSTVSMPSSFTWSTSTPYLITFDTSTGYLSSESFASPS